MIDCSSPEYFEKNKVICNKCGGQIAFYWDHQYWCENCQDLNSLIKLIKKLILEIKFLQVKISKKTQDKQFLDLEKLILKNSSLIENNEERVKKALSKLVQM